MPACWFYSWIHPAVFAIAACFSEMFSSLPLTTLYETIDFKSSFNSYFWSGLPHLQHSLRSGSGLGVVREEEDTAQRHPSHGIGAGLLLKQRETVTGKQQPGQGHWHRGSSKATYWWHGKGDSCPDDLITRAPQSWNFAPKMGLIISFHQAFRTLLCRAIQREKLDALLDCRVWKHNLALYNKLSFKKRL